MRVDYDYFSQCLAEIGADVGASGAHGVVCGLICAGEKEVQQRLSLEWFSERDEGDAAVIECRQGVDELIQAVHASIDGVDLGFPLLLPDEDSPVQQRAVAVRDWCEGFLYGFGLVKFKGEDGLSEPVRESLNDLAEISRMDIDGIVGEEDEEIALTEVTEFIRVAAMLVHDDMVDVGPGRKE